MKMKKAICILFSVLMALSVLSMTASAVATPLEAGSSMASAALIPNFGVDYVSSLSKGGEVDWFKFTTLAEDAYYTVGVRNNNCGSWLDYHLYDVNMKQLAWNGIADNSSKSSNLKLEVNTVYYLRIIHESKGIGNYEISVNYKEDTVPNSMDRAVPVALNQTSVQSLDGAGDVDWFKFTSASISAD